MPITHKVIQVTVSCKNTKEAERIGKFLLKNRLVPCIDIIPKSKAIYYWPPQKNKTKTAKGCFLITYSLAKHLEHIEYTIEKYHSDKAPFISAHEFVHINKAYYKWLSLEVKT